MFTSFESDDRFCYIAGYTSGGAPYGVTWEEMDCDEGCNDESNLFEDRLDHVDKDETEETNLENIDGSGLFLEVKEEEDGIPF